MTHCPRHPLCRRREHQFSAESFEHPPAFQAHALRHRHPEFVAASGADIGQPDAGVAAGWLNNDCFGGEQPIAFCGIDHRHRDPVLHAPERIHIFDLANDRGDAALRDPPQPHQRRPADALGDIVANSCWLRS